jgi:hypothetical protein
MAFDWTAAAFGVLVTATGALATALGLMVRRELDHQRERLSQLDDRLRGMEGAVQLLRPVADEVKRKMDEQAATMVLR